MSTKPFFTFEMTFPLTFRFSVPGLRNPFSSLSTQAAALPALASTQTGTVMQDRFDMKQSSAPSSSSHKPMPPSPAHHQHSFPPSHFPSSSRKRPRDDSNNEPYQSGSMFPTLLASTSARHDEISCPSYQVNATAEATADIPPTKRRKGIAGAVVSTAFNAALIGAAVGLSVYRLWRDRGKVPEALPPPPYQEEWIHAHPVELAEIHIFKDKAKHQTQPESPRKTRWCNTSKHRTGSLRHRQRLVRSRLQRMSKHGSPFPQSDDFETDRLDTQDDILEEMDWIGDRLARLIDEGKRALKREIVISSESPEDEVDDGSSNWADEDTDMSVSTPRFRRSKFASTTVSSCYSDTHASSHASPRTPRLIGHTRFNSGSTMSSTSSIPVTPIQLSPQISVSTSHETWDERTSSAIRESMELARFAYRQKQGLID